jgi:hypothetical protein
MPVRICPADVVQTKGFQVSFRPSGKRSLAAIGAHALWMRGVGWRGADDREQRLDLLEPAFN